MADHRNTGAVALKGFMQAALAVLVSAMGRRVAVVVQQARQTAQVVAVAVATQKNL